MRFIPADIQIEPQLTDLEQKHRLEILLFILSLLNLILSVVGGTVLSMIPVVGLWLFLLMQLFCIFNGIRGIVLSLQGKAKGIPVFGQITIIAYRLPGQ